MNGKTVALSVLFLTFGFTAPVVSLDTSNEVNVPPAASGKDRVMEGNNCFDVGSILTAWTTTKSDYVFIYTWLGKEVHQNLEFVLLEGMYLNLDAIKDPTQYGYNKYYKFIFKPKGADYTTRQHATLVNLNQTIILKLDNGNGTSDYAAIKPVELELKFKSASDLPKGRAWQRDYGKWDWSKGPIPIWEWMTFEWKFWPSIPDAPNNCIGTKWKTDKTAISEEFDIGGIKFNWQSVEESNKKIKEMNKKDKKPGYYPLEGFSLMSRTKFRPLFSNFNEDIVDPSKYIFSEGECRGLGCEKNQPTNGEPTPVWILKFDNKYIAIKPIASGKSGVTYKWRLWPEILPAEETPGNFDQKFFQPKKLQNKTALNK